VVKSGRFILGPEVGELEKGLADYSGVKHAIGVASGTDALVIALRALGAGPGDEVITTPFSFYATASSIVHVGARPVFADIDPSTCLIRPDAIEAAITPKTKGVIVVHLYGQCCEMDQINAIAKKRGLFVIEDACQAVGAGYKGKRAGALADAAALSFYPSKNLGGMGDGGMVLTPRDDVADKVKLLRVHGAAKEYHHDLIGYNSRLDSIQAAILLAKLPHLDQWIEARQRHADIYHRKFQGTAVRPLDVLPERRCVYNNFVVRVEDREAMIERLKARDIGCGVYYPVPLHKLGCFAPMVPPGLDLPGADRACREVLAIPAYPEMTDGMVEEVAEAALAFEG
jgi:dTDP-4-amino-4,6-dideoxygalactose transaminase